MFLPRVLRFVAVLSRGYRHHRWELGVMEHNIQVLQIPHAYASATERGGMEEREREGESEMEWEGERKGDRKRAKIARDTTRTPTLWVASVPLTAETSVGSEILARAPLQTSKARPRARHATVKLHSHIPLFFQSRLIFRFFSQIIHFTCHYWKILRVMNFRETNKPRNRVNHACVQLLQFKVQSYEMFGFKKNRSSSIKFSRNCWFFIIIFPSELFTQVSSTVEFSWSDEGIVDKRECTVFSTFPNLPEAVSTERITFEPDFWMRTIKKETWWIRVSNDLDRSINW